MKRSVPGFLLLSYFLILPVAVVKRSSAVVVFSVGVVVFFVAVVTLDFAVTAMPQTNVHKERAAGEFPISESP